MMTSYVGPLERVTEKNSCFRKVLFTTGRSQLVVMSLLPGEDIGEETHADVDQFFRVEAGHGQVVLNKTKVHALGPGDAVVVPAGVIHNVVNTSAKLLLKLYSIYTPPEHADGLVQRTKPDDGLLDAARTMDA